MSRAIKFRAWWPDEKLMEYDFEHDLGNYLSNETELMQFTGLLDKAGKEIYEGDIVTHAGLKRTGPVVYREDAACFCLAEDTGTTALSYVLISETPWEVRGNIYEDEGLLKKDGE